MDRDKPRLALGAPRPKRPKVPNPANDPRRAREQAARQGLVQFQQQPVQQVPMSLIPPFDANSRLLRDWTLLRGQVGPVYHQDGDICASVVLCRLLQSLFNRNKPVSQHLEFSIKDLANYVQKKTGKLSISNLNIALDYIVQPGLLKKPDGRDRVVPQGHRVQERFEVRRGYSKEEVYARLEETPIGISLEDTRNMTQMGVQEIFDVPIHRPQRPMTERVSPPGRPEPLGHALFVAATGETRIGKEVKDFLVVQNSWGERWCNQGYARIWLNPAGVFDIFWPVEATAKL